MIILRQVWTMLHGLRRWKEDAQKISWIFIKHSYRDKWERSTTYFSVYDDALENLGDDFDLQLLNTTPFEIQSTQDDDPNPDSNEISTATSSPAILLTQNLPNKSVRPSLRTLKIKLTTLINHVANVLKNLEDHRFTLNKAWIVKCALFLE